MSASAIKIRLGTAFSLKNSGGDAVWTPKNTANAHGRLTAQLDLGADPRPLKYRWILVTKFQTAGVAAVTRLYLVEAHSAATTYQDGAIGLSDTDLSTENLLLYSAKQLGPTQVHSAAGTNVFSGVFETAARYISLALWNASGVSLTNTDADHEILIVPYYEEGQ